jgi:hypothetical protein
MNRLRKILHNLRLNENKSTIYDLNIDCLQRVIKKLSINEILRLELVDKKFQFCVQEVLKQQQILCFGKIFCKHSANNSQIRQCAFDIDCDKVNTIIKKCPNIKCLQIKGIVINKPLVEWISNNCKQLVCLHLHQPKSESNSPQIEFKEIGKLLSDKIEIEITFEKSFDMREDAITALIQNMPQMKDINFSDNFNDNDNEISIRELIPHFGQNVRSLYIRGIYDDLQMEDLNAFKYNKNLVELRFDSRVVISQQIFDFICDNLIQLKIFSFDCAESISFVKFMKFFILILKKNFNFLSLRFEY